MKYQKTNGRSASVLSRPLWSNVRSLYKSMGYSDYDLERPMIGIANSWNRATPGHYNLNAVSEYVKQGIFQAGGTPVEFGLIGPCDGVGVGNDGMRYILPSRDIIATSVELMVQAHRLDGVVLLGSCDKIVPGLLMAAARIDIPAILAVGGPMLGGVEFDGRPSDNSSLSEALGMLTEGKVTQEEYDRLENESMPCCGSCSFLGTANTMGAVAEAMGMCLPGSSTIPAVMAERLRSAQATGRTIVEMVREGRTARTLISKPGIENAFKLGMAIGGSTNLALHMPAIAYEAEIRFSLTDMERLSRSTPHLAMVYPSGPRNVPDFHAAGGVPAVMKELAPLLDLDAATCTGKTWREVLEKIPARTGGMIRPLDDPWHPWGSIAFVRGNLAQDGGVTKPIAIHPDMLQFSGTAACFDSEEDATDAVLSGRISHGTILVIRYEGPKGGPGMREMAKIMKMLYGRGLSSSTAVVTDGRFSGTNNGCFVGHVSPEAREGGVIALVRDGDHIDIDIPSGKLNLQVDDLELEARRIAWKPKERPPLKGYLHVYARLAESADKGAIIMNRDTP